VNEDTAKVAPAGSSLLRRPAGLSRSCRRRNEASKAHGAGANGREDIVVVEARSQEKLDRIDIKILMALQADGRITNQTLADAVGLSPSPCLQRRQVATVTSHVVLAEVKPFHGITLDRLL
jgi:hypothetical protein